MSEQRLKNYKPHLNWIDDQFERMCRSLIALAETNSGSFNTKGLEKVCNQLIKLIRPLGGKYEIITLKPLKQINCKGEFEEIPLGKALRVWKRPKASLRIFLGGHMDTVFPEESDFQRVVSLENDMLNGPGVADLKGGLMVMIVALEALERSPWAENIGWEILFNPDEEIGSPGSATLIEQCAKNNDLGLLFEPSFPDGSLASERMGTGNFTAVARGKPAHAGREHRLGRNAICAMADFIQMIYDLNDHTEGLIVNPGFIQGGGPVNVVPDFTILKFSIRIKRPVDETRVLEQLHNVVNSINKREGLSIELHGGFHRSPKILTPAGQRMLELFGDCAADLGMKLRWHATGGCCDGNNLAAAGLPNVDNLGVRGGKTHSIEE